MVTYVGRIPHYLREVVPSHTNHNATQSGSASSNTTDNNDPNHQIQDYFADYYFFVIAVVAIILIAVICWAKGVKRKNRRRAIANGQTPSEHGLYESQATEYIGLRPQRESAPRRPHAREEGLDERGEAPPPYKHGTQSNNPGEETNNDAQVTEVTSPTSVYLRDGPHPKPPIYSEREVFEEAQEDTTGGNHPEQNAGSSSERP